jgi:hypothetical protein
MPAFPEKFRAAHSWFTPGLKRATTKKARLRAELTDD